MSTFEKITYVVLIGIPFALFYYFYHSCTGFGCLGVAALALYAAPFVIGFMIVAAVNLSSDFQRKKQKNKNILYKDISVISGIVSLVLIPVFWYIKRLDLDILPTGSWKVLILLAAVVVISSLVSYISTLMRARNST